MMKLKHKAQLAISELREGRGIEIGVARAVEPHIPAGRTIQRAEQVEQRALPSARCADDGNELAPMDLELDRAQDLERLAVTAREHLPKAAPLE